MFCLVALSELLPGFDFVCVSKDEHQNQAGQLHSDALDQLEDGCPGTVFVLAQMPGSLIVYIDWSSDCLIP